MKTGLIKPDLQVDSFPGMFPLFEKLKQTCQSHQVTGLLQLVIDRLAKLVETTCSKPVVNKMISTLVFCKISINVLRPAHFWLCRDIRERVGR